MGGGPNSSLWQLGLFLAGVYFIVRYPHRYPRLRPFIRGYSITIVILSILFFVGTAVYGWDEMGVPAGLRDLFRVAVALQIALCVWLIFGKRPRGVVPPPPVATGGFQPQAESNGNQSAKREEQVGLIKLSQAWSHARQGDDWKPDKYQLTASIRLEGETEDLVVGAASPVWDALLDAAAYLVEKYPELADEENPPPPPPPPAEEPERGLPAPS